MVAGTTQFFGRGDAVTGKVCRTADAHDVRVHNRNRLVGRVREPLEVGLRVCLDGLVPGAVADYLDIDVGLVELGALAGGDELHFNARVQPPELWESRHQPAGERCPCSYPELRLRCGGGDPLGRDRDRSQMGSHRGKVRLARLRQRHRVRGTAEQGHAEPVLQQPDMAADRPGSHYQLPGGAADALQSSGGLEGAQGVQWWQAQL